MKRLLFLLALLPTLLAADWQSSPRPFTYDELNDLSAEEFIAQAEAGDMICQYQLAVRYEAGLNSDRSSLPEFATPWPQDAEKALAWYRKAAEQGFTRAMYRLALWYEHADGPLQRDITEAVKWYTRCAEAGDSDAQIRLGRLYEHGTDGLPPDAELAGKWYLEATRHGRDLGIKHYRATRLQADLRQRIDAGDAAACYEMAEHLLLKARQTYTQPDAEFVQWYRKAAEKGHAPAMFALGLLGFCGDAAANISAEETLHFFQQAADAGSADALLYLGLCYAQGKGVERDDARAFQLLQQADAKDAPHAAQMLAYACVTGTGVEQSDEQTLHYLRKSHGISNDADDGAAEGELGELYFMLDDDATAVKWHTLSSEKGNPAAKLRLGLYYLAGKGVPQDPAKAFTLFREINDEHCERSDDKEIKTLLAACHFLGWGTPADEAAAIRCLKDPDDDDDDDYPRYNEPEDDETLLLQVIHTAVALAIHAGDPAAVQKCVDRMETLAESSKELAEAWPAARLAFLLFIHATRNTPEDDAKAVRLLGDYLRDEGEAEEDLTDGFISLKIAEALIHLDRTADARRWLTRSGTLNAKLLAAELRQKSKKPEKNFLLHIHYSNFHKAPMLPVHVFSR